MYEFATPVLNTFLDVSESDMAALKALVLSKMEAAASDTKVSRSTKGEGSWHSAEILDW